MYDYEKAKAALIAIRERYWRPVIAHPNGYLTHYAYCDTYRPVDMYDYAPCTCGMHCDLSTLDMGLVEKLNPDYWNEERRQEVGRFYKPKTAKQLEEMDRTLQQALDITLQKPDPIDEETLTMYEERDWKLIAEVFGQEYATWLRTEAPHDQRCDKCGETWSSKLKLRGEKCHNCPKRIAEPLEK